jgi:hypothetical protein
MPPPSSRQMPSGNRAAGNLLGPDPTVIQRRRSTSNVECREPRPHDSPTMSVRPSGVITVPLGNMQFIGDDAGAPIGVDSESVRPLSGRRAGVQVEPEIADVGASAGVHHHVVAVKAGEGRQVGVLVERPSRKRSRRRSVMETTSRSPPWSAASRDRRASPAPRRRCSRCRLRGHAQHLMVVHVGQPQGALMPAWPLAEAQVVDERLRLHVMPPSGWSV